MKSSFITFLTLFFILGTVVAAPTTLDSTEVVKREGFQELDVILNEAFGSLVQKNTAYNSTSRATITDVTSYCNDIISIINIVITKCRLIPSGHTFLDTNIIAAILFKILCEINFTLRLLLSKCGLLGGLILLITLLVGGLITVLNQLLFVVSGVCGTGLLGLLSALILNNCGPNFLLLLLGLII
ncbi:hypothetical protein B9Z19DRAFT_1111558 [Tuber borchii]|uniref:Actin cortical patch SUR7/pH-response regulator pali n=1 Tax=Tuber borchii TaxID=42251 RepID=A0A2T6ZBF0_TUBBO|nr:hypothetical protein B9Z19DRAFT_1111558 [Tuber borchii]